MWFIGPTGNLAAHRHAQMSFLFYISLLASSTQFLHAYYYDTTTNNSKQPSTSLFLPPNSRLKLASTAERRKRKAQSRGYQSTKTRSSSMCTQPGVASPLQTNCPTSCYTCAPELISYRNRVGIASKRTP